MNEQIKIFTGAVFSGIFIAIAGTVFLCVPNPIVGAFMFAFGLMTILVYGFKLYTGAIGYLVNQGKNTPKYLLTLLTIWLGNLLGTFAVGNLIRCTRTFPKIETRVLALCKDKLDDGFLSILFLSICCGILMYVAVEAYRQKELAPAFRIASVFLCVAVFILSGFEHCVANMFYFSVGGPAVWTWHTLVWVLVMTLGNSIGGWLIPLGDKIRN